MHYCDFQAAPHFAVATANQALYQQLGHPSTSIGYRAKDGSIRIHLASRVTNDLAILRQHYFPDKNNTTISFNEQFSGIQGISSPHPMQILCRVGKYEKYTDVYSQLLFYWATYHSDTETTRINTTMKHAWLRKNITTGRTEESFVMAAEVHCRLPSAIIHQNRDWYIFDTFFCCPVRRRNSPYWKGRNGVWHTFYDLYRDMYLKYTHVDAQTHEHHHLFLTIQLENDGNQPRTYFQCLDRKREYKGVYQVLHCPPSTATKINTIM